MCCPQTWQINSLTGRVGLAAYASWWIWVCSICTRKSEFWEVSMGKTPEIGISILKVGESSPLPSCPTKMAASCVNRKQKRPSCFPTLVNQALFKVLGRILEGDPHLQWCRELTNRTSWKTKYNSTTGIKRWKTQGQRTLINRQKLKLKKTVTYNKRAKMEQWHLRCDVFPSSHIWLIKLVNGAPHLPVLEPIKAGVYKVSS